MATKKKPAAEAAPAKKADNKKKGKKVLTDAEKAERRAKMKERLANRPEGQRPNSKQIDIIQLENGSKVLSFGMPVRKKGTLVTTIALNSKGEVVSTSSSLVLGVSPKVKKGHGSLVPKVPGFGKKSQPADTEEDDDEDEE